LKRFRIVLTAQLYIIGNERSVKAALRKC